MYFDRDFAYVARDRVSKKHKCHVFRCDTPARQIANTLRDICKKIMLERSLREGVQVRSVQGSKVKLRALKAIAHILWLISEGVQLR